MDAPMQSALEGLARLQASNLPRILFVTHGLAGGIARHIRDLVEIVKDDAEVLLLQPAPVGHLRLRWARTGNDWSIWPHGARDWEAFIALLQAIGIDRVHFHHVHGLPQRVLDLPALLDCAHDLTAHDYYCVCPTYHLLDGAGRYCGAGPSCRHCLESRKPQWPLSIDEWRAAFAPLLASARRVIAIPAWPR
jgi:hypothetical protein